MWTPSNTWFLGPIRANSPDGISISSPILWATIIMVALCCRLIGSLSCRSCPVCLSVGNVGVLWPNSWMDQGETWCGDRPRPRPHCVRWRPSSRLQKRGTAAPSFLAHVSWPNGCIDQDATWYEGRPRPRRHCLRRGPSSPLPHKNQPFCSPASICCSFASFDASTACSVDYGVTN